MRIYFIRFRVSVTNLIMSNFEFLTVAQLEQQIDNKKRKNSTLFTVEFKCKVITSYLKRQKPEIPHRHKSFNFFQKLTGIDRRTIQKWVQDKDLYFNTPYKRYFNLLSYMILTK